MSTCAIVTPSGRKVPCTFGYNLKRDIFGLPNMVIGQFLVSSLHLRLHLKCPAEQGIPYTWESVLTSSFRPIIANLPFLPDMPSSAICTTDAAHLELRILMTGGTCAGLLGDVSFSIVLSTEKNRKASAETRVQAI